jgi:hypothetical protein
MMTGSIDGASVGRHRLQVTPVGRRPRDLRKNDPESRQAIEKARFGKANPRKSKHFSWIFFGLALLDFAGFD